MFVSTVRKTNAAKVLAGLSAGSSCSSFFTSSDCSKFVCRIRAQSSDRFPLAVSAQRWSRWNSSTPRRRYSGTAVGEEQNESEPIAPAELTSPPPMALPKHIEDIRELHPLHSYTYTYQARFSILTFPNAPSKRWKLLCA
jgi:hypothetical protein